MDKKRIVYHPEIIGDDNNFYMKNGDRIYINSIGFKCKYIHKNKIFYWLLNGDLISCQNLIDHKDLVEKNRMVGNTTDDIIISTGKIVQPEHGKKIEIIETNINGTIVQERKEIKNEFLFECENVQYIERMLDGRFIILKSDHTWQHMD